MIWFIIKRFLDKSTESCAKHSSSATLFLHISINLKHFSCIKTNLSFEFWAVSANFAEINLKL